LLLPSVPAAEAGSPADTERHQVFAGVVHLVRAAARERGAVVALEDLHASDTAMLGLAHYLVRAAGRAPPLIVITARPGEAGPEPRRWRAGLREQRAGVEVVLRPVSKAAIRRIAERAAGCPLEDATIDAIAAPAAGNPFFAEELAASLEDGGGVHIPDHVHEIL